MQAPRLVVLRYGSGLGAANHSLAALTATELTADARAGEVLITRADMPPFTTDISTLRCSIPVTYETMHKEMVKTIFLRDFEALEACNPPMVRYTPAIHASNRAGSPPSTRLNFPPLV